MGEKWPHEISEKGQLIVRSPSLTSDGDDLQMYHGTI